MHNAQPDIGDSRPGRRPPFASAVVVTADGGHASVDRDFLRRAGVTRARTFHCARHALAHLRRHGAELVILGDALDDMPGLDFLRQLRRDRSLAATPVIVASQDNSREAILDAAAAGCSGYLLRPYSARAFAGNLIRARRGVARTRAARAAVDRARKALDQDRPDQAVAELEALTTDSAVARKLYDSGCAHLAAKRLDPAIEFFQRAVAVDTLFAEAHMGLSRAWKAKGFPDRSRQHARRAAQCYTRLEHHAEARRIFVDVLKTAPQGLPRHLEAAERLVRGGLFDEAAPQAAMALRAQPPDEVFRGLKRACHFTADPMASARALADTLSRQKGMPTPPALMRRIMGKDNPAPHAAETVVPGRRDAASSAGEWWEVVKYVWRVFLDDAPLPVAVEPLEI